METPSAANRFATVLLPQAIPPVRPDAEPARHVIAPEKKRQVAVHDVVAGHQRQPAGDGEERAEGNRGVAALALADHDHDAEDGADAGGEHDDGQQHLPAEPRAERGEQLEVAVAHAFLAGEQLEGPVDAPQAEIAGDGADDAVARSDGLAPSPQAGCHRLTISPSHSSG